MGLHRIGDKIISNDRLASLIEEILKRRSAGATQEEVASKFGIQRSFVSNLEGLGEVRRGRRIAVVGFPISNKEEVDALANEFAVDYVYLMNEDERVEFALKKSGAEIFNEVLSMLANLKGFDVVIVMASDWRISTLQKILDREVYGIPIGRSPITESKRVDPAVLREVLASVAEGKIGERGRQRKFRIFKKESRGRSGSPGRAI
ncbi:MAG: helix-turn-helix transcriptional regulator [Chloroflexi bacterium]|nr:helix-turn-helix transcriptional regulator [Chloroflexota bacterium]